MHRPIHYSAKPFLSSLILLVLTLTLALSGSAQTFRGGINGTVTDVQGAVVPNAAVTAMDVDTSATHATVSSSAGTFSFQDLPLGNYSVTVAFPGFSTAKFSNVAVSAGATYTLPVRLSVSSTGTTVEVDAAGVALDTTTAVLTTDIPTQMVNEAPSNGRDFTQLIQYTPGFAGYSIAGGAGAAQVDGVRTNQVNWQIEGTDNNDLWWNIPAVNQGGVSGIAGVVIPLDAIDQFSFVTSGMPETGRNAGGTVNLSIKSGTNSLHGSAYYYNRNEFFAANSPFNPVAKKTETRDIDYGASVGGPIIKDKLFFFASYEHQGFIIGAAQAKTEPSAAYQALATGVLGFYGMPVNPVSTALLANLWPQSALTGAAVSGNYFNPGTENGHSFNPIVKLDYNINARNSISVKGYFGNGNQTAPSTSELSPYFEVAPIHVENYSLIYNLILSPHLTNQAFFGVSYFDQVFSDAQHSYNPVALGLNTGVVDPTLSGAPKLTIGGASTGSGLTSGASGFDPIGVTAPAGRQDITGHFNDAVAYSIGKHEFRFGGEFRKAQVYDFYQTNARGVFTFDGSQGPWHIDPASGLSSGSAACQALATKNLNTPDPAVTDGNVLLLADFLAGCISTNNATIAEGNQKRTVFENTWDVFAQDAWQITSRLNLNYGIRYDYAQSVHDAAGDLTSFNAATPGGFDIQGKNVSDLYHPFKGSVSPRIGASYVLDDKTTLRMGAGMFFDSIYMLSILNLRNTTDGGALGIGNNLAGAAPVLTAQALPTNAGGGAVIQSGVPIFSTLAAAQAGAGVTNAYSINPNYRPSYTYSYNLNVQRQIGTKVIAQLGYLGTLSRRLTSVLDINATAVGSGEDATTRPYYHLFPQIGNVNQLNGNLNSNYNSLQALLRSSSWHGLTSQVVYTWSHALDYETGFVPYLPEDSTKQYLEYGNSDFDTRNTFSAIMTYQIPAWSAEHKALSNGWELNAALSLHGGQPYNVVANSDELGNGDSADRANVTGIDPYKGVSHAITGGVVTWFNPAAFSEPSPGQYGNQRRNQFFNPGFSDVDFSIVKDTHLAERLTLQLRAETFNLFNRINLAPVGLPQTSAGGTITSTIGAYNGAPGIGPGEPFNVQFAGKIIF